MECRVFRKKANDLLEDNISNDLKDAMIKHMEDCRECKALYDEDVLIDEEFRMALKIEPKSFRSLRGDIMKNIDKNRYKKGPLNKLKLHFKRFKAAYSTAAAVILLAVSLTSYALKGGFSLGAAKKAESGSAPQTAMKSAVDMNIEKDEAAHKFAASQNEETQKNIKEDAKQDDTSGRKESFEIEKPTSGVSYLPKFKKEELNKNYKVSFNMPWEISPSKKYGAAVEGKGEEAFEEGIANIVVKDLNSNKQWSFGMINNEEKQYTPKAVKWITDETLLIIVGYGYGTISPGGKLYLLNVDKADTIAADPLNSAKLDEKKNSQISKILDIRYSEGKPLEIDVEVTIYDDDAFINSHTEKRTVTSYIPPFN